MRPDQPSRTALVVAGGVVFAAGDAALRDNVDPEAARLTRLMLGASGAGRRLLRQIDSGVGRAMFRLLERCTIPGIIRHWVCRKQWLEQAWLAARQDGFDTLVVLGSGFDTLSLRVAQRDAGKTRTFDVDHPATLAARRRGIVGLARSSHRLIEHDLARPGLGRLLADSLPADASSFVLIEGVLMYVEPRRLDELFDELSNLGTRRLRLAFTFMESRAGAPPAFRPRSRLIDLWLRWRGEPFCSGLDPDALDTWLQQRRFRLVDFSATPGRTGERVGQLRGECAAVADRNEPASVAGRVAG